MKRNADWCLGQYARGMMGFDDAAIGYCKAMDIYSEANVIVCNELMKAYHHSFNCAVNLRYS